jgi:hypothetical protein
MKRSAGPPPPQATGGMHSHRQPEARPSEAMPARPHHHLSNRQPFSQVMNFKDMLARVPELVAQPPPTGAQSVCQRTP